VEQTVNRWNNTPPYSIAVFLAAVFLVFSSLGFVVDSINMGQQSSARLAWGAGLSGIFAVAYATGGMIMRSRFWKAVIPIFLLQFAGMFVLGHFYPDSPNPNHLNPQQISRLEHRLNFDGVAIILAVCLSYAGFAHVSIREGRRHGRAQLEKATLESEMAAAHEVQSVLVSEAIPKIPGYTIDTIYHPAAQVGGDLFQIIPLSNGSTLIAIGDVSGKGLRAAMIVSLIIGTLRTLCTAMQEPAAILNELNRHLHGRMQDGFVTCLLVRIDSGGKLLLANAGHMPPYRNGSEIPLPGSLPLGLTADTTYDQLPIELAIGDSLVLLTDGVAEAQDSRHQIFGFSRIESTLRSGASVQALAEEARQHGQTDDITLLSITRKP
jgi:hypothetical protein